MGIGILWLLLFFCAFVLGPFLGIWAINTLFGLSITFGFKTWIAMLILIGVFNGQVHSK